MLQCKQDDCSSRYLNAKPQTRKELYQECSLEQQGHMLPAWSRCKNLQVYKALAAASATSKMKGPLQSGSAIQETGDSVHHQKQL